MVDGKKLDNIIKQGSIVTSSSSFTNLLVASLPSTDKMFYIDAWAKAQTGSGSTSNFFKRISTAGYGNSTLTLIDGYEIDLITETIDPDSSGFDARISVNGTTVELQIHSANSQSATFYGYLDVHVIEISNDSPATIFGSNLELWLRSDLGVRIDSSNNITRWEDQSGKGNHFMQSTVADRPVYTETDGYWGSLPSLHFDGANTYLISEDDVSTWTFLHDGYGSGIFVVYRIDSAADWQILANTMEGTPIGFRLIARRDSDATNYAIYDTSAVVFENQGVANPNLNQWMALRYEYNIAGDDASFWRNGIEVHSEESAVAPASGDADSTFVLGSYTSGATNFLDGDIIEVIACSVRPSDAQMDSMVSYLNIRYALNPKQILGDNLHTWLRSDLGVITSGSAVTDWKDQSGNGHHFSQSTGGNRPTYNTTDSNWANLPSLTFDGSTDSLTSDNAADIWKLLHDGTGSGLFIVYRPSGVTDDTQFLFATGGGSSNIGSRARATIAAGDDMGWNVANGSVNIINQTISSEFNAVEQWLLVAYENNKVGNEFGLYRSTPTTTTGNDTAAPSTSDPVSTLRIGSNQNGTENFEGEIVEVMIFDIYPSDEQIERLKLYITFRYGLS